MISTIAMGAVLALWFFKIYVISATGIVTPVMPMNLLVIAIISAAVFGDNVRRRLS